MPSDLLSVLSRRRCAAWRDLRGLPLGDGLVVRREKQREMGISSHPSSITFSLIPLTNDSPRKLLHLLLSAYEEAKNTEHHFSIIHCR